MPTPGRRVLRHERGEVTRMPLFVPDPRTIRDLKRKLRDVEREKDVARSQLAGALADLDRLDGDTDSLLALLSAETENRQ